MTTTRAGVRTASAATVGTASRIRPPAVRSRSLAASLLGVAAAAAVAGCGAAATDVPSPTAIVIPGTFRAVPITLTVALHGEPTRTFIIAGGRWRVCDTGSVTNPSAVVAVDVRVTVTYVDHGVIVGRQVAADAPADGGALGDLAPGASHPFVLCGIASNEPDEDRVQAQVGA